MSAILSDIPNQIAEIENNNPPKLKCHAFMNFLKNQVKTLKVSVFKRFSIPMTNVTLLPKRKSPTNEFQDAGSNNIKRMM